MSIPRFYLNAVQFTDGKLTLDRDAKKKLTKVLRLGEGDAVEILAPFKRWECRIVKILADAVEIERIKEMDAPAKSRVHLILGQAIPKGDRFDWLIQKATELGVAEIYPLITERTVVRPGQSEARMQRWNEIAHQAAAQCEGAAAAYVHEPLPLDRFLKLPDPGLRILLQERAGYFSLRSLMENVKEHRITFVVGPEGGWTPNETAAMVRAGFTRIQLGKRILRSDTAGLVMAAILQYSCGDFSD